MFKPTRLHIFRIMLDHFGFRFSMFVLGDFGVSRGFVPPEVHPDLRPLGRPGGERKGISCRDDRVTWRSWRSWLGGFWGQIFFDLDFTGLTQIYD